MQPTWQAWRSLQIACVRTSSQTPEVPKICSLATSADSHQQIDQRSLESISTHSKHKQKQRDSVSSRECLLLTKRSIPSSTSWTASILLWTRPTLASWKDTRPSSKMWHSIPQKLSVYRNLILHSEYHTRTASLSSCIKRLRSTIIYSVLSIGECQQFINTSTSAERKYWTRRWKQNSSASLMIRLQHSGWRSHI